MKTRTSIRRVWGWGGWRPGAGRKPKGAVAGPPHRRRPAVGWRDGVLVRWGTVAGVELALEPARGVVRGVLGEFAAAGLAIEGYALERGRLWLRVRARSRRALTRGLRSFAVRVAQALNRRFRRRGRVFAGRYEQWLVADLQRGGRHGLPARILRRVLRPLPAA